MNKIKVLYVSAAASGYGGENVLFDLVTRLPEPFKPIVLVPERGPLYDNLKRAGVAVELIPYAVLHKRYFHALRFFLYIAFALFSTVRLLGLFKRLKPDIVHTNNVLILPGAFGAKLLGIPHIWHVREVIRKYHISEPGWRVWRAMIQRMSSKVICISRAVRDQFEASEKTIVIHDGVDTGFFSPPGKDDRTASTRDDQPSVGLVGRVEHRRKGQDIFIEAARLVVESEPKTNFVIVGGERPEFHGRERRLYEMIDTYGLKDNVRFLGHVPREKIVDVLNRFDILVVSSRMPEGLGIVLLEAMACGIPVIAPREGGPLDIIEDGKSGILVEPRNPETLAQAILILLRNRSLRDRLGRAAKERVGKMFSIDDHVERVTRVYREVLSKNRMTET